LPIVSPKSRPVFIPVFFILVKDTCSKFSSDERVQTEALNTAQEEVGEHNLTGTPGSKVIIIETTVFKL